MSFLDKIQKFKSADTTGFVKLFVGTQCFGMTLPALAKEMATYSAVWCLRDDGLSLHPDLHDFTTRSDALDAMLRDLSARDILPHEPDYSQFGGTDWFPVGGADRKINPLFKMRRFYTRFLGVQVDCVMINGYQRDGYWAAVRSQNVHYEQGKHDLMVAGCVLIEHTIDEEALDEGKKECGLSAKDMPFVKHVQTIQMLSHNRAGYLINEIFYIYDYDTTDRFTPYVVDEFEVDRFDLLGFDDMIKRIRNGESFRSEVMVVMIDFLLRHGYIPPEDPEYPALIELLAKTHDLYA